LLNPGDSYDLANGVAVSAITASGSGSLALTTLVA
jgi:hypothetical protein